MAKQQNYGAVNEREQLLQHMQACEKQISDCSIEKFSDLRIELKQLKEKLRLLQQLERMND